MTSGLFYLGEPRFSLRRDVPSADDLQHKRIKGIVLPILAVVGGFLLLPFDAAILFTAVVIFGVFVCGNGPVNVSGNRSLPRKEEFKRQELEEENPWLDVPPEKPGFLTRVFGTPKGLTPSKNSTPTPTTLSAIEREVEIPSGALKFIATNASPSTLARGLSSLRGGQSLEKKQSTPSHGSTPGAKPRTPGLETLSRNLSGEFGLAPVEEDPE